MSDSIGLWCRGVEKQKRAASRKRSRPSFLIPSGDCGANWPRSIRQESAQNRARERPETSPPQAFFDKKLRWNQPQGLTGIAPPLNAVAMR